MIAAWWTAQSPRDRRMLASGAVVVAVLLAWAFAWHPLMTARASLRTRVDADRRDLAYVRIGAAEVASLHASGQRTRGERAGKSLLALADATARSAGLGHALARVEPVGAGAVRVGFDTANFDSLMRWIDGLERDYGVEVSEFSADRADGVGLVNARVTLQDAP